MPNKPLTSLVGKKQGKPPKRQMFSESLKSLGRVAREGRQKGMGKKVSNNEQKVTKSDRKRENSYTVTKK